MSEGIQVDFQNGLMHLSFQEVLNNIFQKLKNCLAPLLLNQII